MGSGGEPAARAEGALGLAPRLTQESPPYRLPRSFYERDAVTVARDLIGCLFVCDDMAGRARPNHGADAGRVAVRLVETEAYRGALDPGSHGYRGPTARTRSMFGPPGRLYVYFTYGMHWCVNVVCGREGISEAVLLRAGEPVAGLDVVRRRRAGIDDDRLLASGPARLAQSLGINRRDDGASLLRGGRFWCAEDARTRELRGAEIARTRRIGLAVGRGDALEWRFVIPGHPHASRRT